MGRKEWHIEGDACEAMRSTAWDMIIAFPPCTHLAASGARHFAAKRADGRQAAAIDFFMAFVEAKASYKAIENPIGVMSSEYRKPDQIIHPWMFGYPTTKATCLWLYNLPLLVPTKVVNKGEVVTLSSGKRMSKWYYDISTRPVAERAAARSATFPGVAEAMAEQWGDAVRRG
jgi:site-specific DNA-cytosine methylase